MAYLRQRGTAWQARVVRKGFPPIAKTFPTKEQAEAWAISVEGALLVPLPGSTPAAPLSTSAASHSDSPPGLTLKQALERYEREVTPAKRGARQEKRRIAQLLKSDLSSVALRELKSGHFARYRDQRLRTLASNTVRLELALLSHLFEVARKEWDIVDQAGEALPNPLRLVRKPKAPQGRDRRLTSDDMERITKALRARKAASKWLLPLIALLTETGMRRGEVAGLRRTDVDLSRRIATLRTTKNGTRRHVPLSTKAVSAIEALLAIRSRRSEFVLPVNPDAVTRTWVKVRKDAEITDLRVHDLRHEATSRLFESGKFSLPEVAAITGHKTPAMLMRYTHPRAEDLARKLD